MVAVVFVVCGTAWSQTLPINWSGFDWMYADTADSTESATSAGIFSSDIDNYIGVNSYNPAGGMFAFAGGGNAVNANNISLGFSAMLDAGYLGIYYGGGLVNAEGSKDDAAKTTESTADWNNNLAVIFGLKDGLSFRFDLRLSPNADRMDVDGDITEAISDDTRIAFTLGGFKLGGMTSYVTAGFQFPISETMPVGGDNITRLGTSMLGVQFGLSADSGFYADALLNIGFAGSVDGKANENEGLFGIAFQAGYGKTFEFGKFAFGINPHASIYLGFPYKTFDLDVTAGIDLGASFKINDKFALYTGASIQLLQWQTETVTDVGNEWTFDGIKWDPAGLIGVGLTFAPVQNVVIGADVSNFINRLITVNPATLQVGTGSGFNQTTNDNFGDWITHWFRGVTFGLTVSCKF